MRATRHARIVNVDERLIAGKGRSGVPCARLAARTGAHQLGCDWMQRSVDDHDREDTG
jgi:hypothetical protein